MSARGEAIRHIWPERLPPARCHMARSPSRRLDNPRMRILIDDEAGSKRARAAWARAAGSGITEMALRLNAAGTKLPQGERWTKSPHPQPLLRAELDLATSPLTSATRESRKSASSTRRRGYTRSRDSSIGPLARHFTERSVGCLRPEARYPDRPSGPLGTGWSGAGQQLPRMRQVQCVHDDHRDQQPLQGPQSPKQNDSGPRRDR